MSDNFEAISEYVLGRIANYAEFAARRMPRKTAEFYVADVRFMVAKLLELSSEDKEGLLDYMGDVGAVMRNRPLTRRTVMSTINGDMSAEISARKLSIEHVLDLAYSYRRFNGIVPCGKEEFLMRQTATTIITSHLESFLSK